MRKWSNIFRIWLPFAALITACCALAYASMQQSLRQSANDPQIQMAEDAAYALNHGAALAAVIPSPQIEMSRSLAPFVVVYDLDGKPYAGSGLLDGQLPDYPQGALDRAKQGGENRVTWQPNSLVRIASVVVPWQDGFVMAGRSLREVEHREARAEGLAAFAWIVALIGTFMVIVFAQFLLPQE